MTHFIFVGLVCGIVGAGYGLAAAFALKLVQRLPRMPRWPVVTGLLIGLGLSLTQIAGIGS